MGGAIGYGTPTKKTARFFEDSLTNTCPKGRDAVDGPNDVTVHFDRAFAPALRGGFANDSVDGLTSRHQRSTDGAAH